MAIGDTIWGIDIGQCAIKALRCSVADDGETVVADAFDYIEYPKILSQPEANPAELIHEALEQFLSRNSVRDDKVAISVSGQAGLARFIKLPPVEQKQLPNLVKYEAKQQIPFNLEDVIWDYQPLPGGSEGEGVALELEVGLFAMKRDQVFRALQPFNKAGIELDIVQLTPVAIYNAVAFELLNEQLDAGVFDPNNPPPSIVVLSLGTDTTELVITNGFRIFQRNIALGGNHFTRQLTKELKLTFAKAEHLKRNARQAEDARTIFQAMRPVFNDLVKEVQRSLAFFQNLEKKAKLSKIVVLGNAIKLPGLQQYLAKNVEMEVTQIDSFRRLAGPTVVGAPAFKENLLSFPVSYGLCLQGLDQAPLGTSLLPQEILVERMIRRKKPWAVAAVGLLLLGLCFSFFFYNRAWQSSDTSTDVYKRSFQQVGMVSSKKSNLESEDQELLDEVNRLKKLGEGVVGNAEGRLLLPELYTAIDSALPHENTGATIPRVTDKPLDERRFIYIESIDSEFYPELRNWFNTKVQQRYQQFRQATAGGATPPAATDPANADPNNPDLPPAGAPGDGGFPGEPPADGGEGTGGPSGPGWVFEITAYHYFNKDRRNRGGEYVRNTLLKNLEDGEFMLPSGPGKQPEKYTMKELGISYPILARAFPPSMERIENLEYEPGSPDKTPEGAKNLAAVASFTIEKFRFKVQFCWQETPATLRLERRAQKKLEKANPGNEVASEY